MAPNKAKSGEKAAAQKKMLEAFLSEGDDFVQTTSAKDLDIEVIKDFSNFNTDHMKRANKIVDRLSNLSLSDTIDMLSRLPKSTRDSLFTATIMRRTFRMHKDTADLQQPPLHQTDPQFFFSEECLAHLINDDLDEGELNIDVINDTYKEHKIAWFREDVGINEHHFYWHEVYPTTEAPKFKRQGELFVYMHQQMLARYDFERLALGFDRVHALGPGYNWHEPIKEGYNSRLKGMSFRATNHSVVPVTKFKDGLKTKLLTTDKMARQRDRIFDSILQGYYQKANGDTSPLTMADLGVMVEANEAEDADLPDRNFYGNVHNQGHIIIASINDPERIHNIPHGPMFNTSTAIRDPLFFRWHKYIDGIFEEYRVLQNPYTAQDLTFSGIKIENLETIISSGAQDESGEVNQLYTYFHKKSYLMRRVPQDVKKLEGSTTNGGVLKKELDHLPFMYKIKIANNKSKPALVALRIFLAPTTTTTLDEWRNMYIELDRFVVEVPPGVKDVERLDDQSSVVLDRSPTIEEMEQDVANSDVRNGICGCGWPLHLLIPKGTEANMSAKLFVIATDWSEDRHDSNATLDGSVSYCGKSGLPYPDKKPMGYPFDRAMGYTHLHELVDDVPNSFVTDIKIRHKPNRPQA